MRRGCGPAILAAAPECALDAADEGRVHPQNLVAGPPAKNIARLGFHAVDFAVVDVMELSAHLSSRRHWRR